MRETRRLGVANLLVLADVARLSGHAAAGRGAAGADPAGLPARPQAPLAALALARLELDALDRPARAAAVVNRALALGVPAACEKMCAPAWSRPTRGGDRTAARAAAAAYVREFPNGRDLGIVESQMR